MRDNTAAQMRRWTGPGILSFGFRPFFLLGAIWAAFVMVLWVLMLAGWIVLPTAFDGISWHAHAMIFGYLGAVIAGFLLTAVPNWTGRLPVVGWRLAVLVSMWAIGRAAVLFSSLLPSLLVAVLDLSILAVLWMFLAREIVVGRNWQNLIVLIPLLMLISGGGLFHWQAAHGDIAANGSGFRLSLAAVILLIAIVGGRIVPSFTRNWLAKRKHPTLPTPPMAIFDKAALLFTAWALGLWVFQPATRATGAALFIVGLLHLVRLARWCGHLTLTEPLLWVLHAAYAFVPFGALALGLSPWLSNRLDMASAQHLWMAGAIGLMTLAVMTRATLGHTGQALHAGAGTTFLYLALLLAVFIRFIAGFWPAMAGGLYTASGLLWIAAFLGFAVLYGPQLLQRKEG